MNIQEIGDAILGAVVRVITGETAAQKIVRKRAEINAVVSRNSAAINATIDAEIDALRHVVQTTFGRIEELVSTDAAGGDKAKAIKSARTRMGDALEALDAAF